MGSDNPFIICKAAAGSGKTYNLVREYLRLAMAGGEADIEHRFRGILAITFTNKAANEMKSRIMDTLDDMAAHDADPRQRMLAQRLRSAILHRYSDLSVCTIDSFMHRVVRTFAHDLDQPVNFEVMVEQDTLIEQAVSGLMALIGTPGNEDLTAVVQQFATSRMENEKGFDIVGSLTALATQLFVEGTDEYLKRLSRFSLSDYMEMYRRYSADNQAFVERMEALGAEAMRLLGQAGMTEETCYYGKSGFYSFFKRMEHFGQSVRERQKLTPSNRTVEVFEGDDYSGAKLCKAKVYRPEADTIADDLRRLYRDISANLGEGLVDFNTRTLLLTNLFSMALLGELDRQLHTIAKDNEVLHLSEFNRLINKVVQDEPAPFIYERLGSRYHHFLIDEFQDTSVLQWQNLVPLLENGVGQGYESLVVGDGKQAIYRFRQGDVRQFVALPRVEGMPLHGATLSHPGNYRVKHLDTNYRTAEAVVNFNNDFFSWLVRNHYADNELARKIYLGPDGDSQPGEEELRQKCASAGNGVEGHVGLSFVDGGDSEAICNQVLQIILWLTGECGYSARDIMVLGRTRRELATVGSYLLEHSDLEQCSAESFYLRNSGVVMALVAALRCLADSGDRVAAAELLHRLHGLGLIASPHDEAFLNGSPIDLQSLLAQEGIDFNSGYLLSMDLYDCCEELLRQLRADGLDTAYVASLLNKVAAFTARHNQSLGKFLEWFDEHPDLSASLPEGDAVRLMTIHKAKGLEAQVVICPFFNVFTRPKGLWVDAAGRYAPYDKSLPAAYVTLSKDVATRFDADRDREHEESDVDDLNILYVAFTRPRERLYVVCPCPGEGGRVSPVATVLAEYAAENSDYGDALFSHVTKEEVSDKQSATVRHLSFSDWTGRVMIASPAETSMTPLMEEKVRFGIRAHALLATVEHAVDAGEAVRRYVEREHIEDAEGQRLASLVREVVSHPDTARFFDPTYKVRCECDLTDGSTTGRPDRIVFTPDETWVVDFKTGGDQPDEYDRQLQHYCRAIAAMGYPKVSGWLVFLQPSVSVREVGIEE
ncbi:MAG: UvrD-helicase domain-containing protein [bacterium]